MAFKTLDLVGLRFGKLLVLRRTEERSASRNYFWECKCDCGKTCKILANNLRAKKNPTRSCGCLQGGAIKHGKSADRVYRIWSGMKHRCENPKSQHWVRYGGQGIRVCTEWKTFEGFYKDMGDPPSSRHSIDRIDGTGNYEPGNCRWATPKEQSENLRTVRWIEFRGERKTMSEFAREYGLAPAVVWHRISLGWTLEEAFTTPVKSSVRSA